jgi:predicted AAA+ superfamily ATPase
MIQRSIYSAIEKISKVYPVIALTGPRQSGKTTLLKNLFSNYRYISLENPDERAFALSDPNGFLDRYDNRVIFDEVQRVPELFSYIQTKVDNSGLMGQYILSGSQNFLMMKSITQSLAGRVALFKLLPFDFGELKSADLLPDDYDEAIVKGGYPALYVRDIPVSSYYSNYIETYIERDINEILNVRDLKLFRSFLKLCAGRVGQQLSLNSLSNDAGVSIPTVSSWLSILESSYVIYQLPPFFKNFNKRLVKSPKLYFYDTGLASILLGEKKAENIALSPFKGALFENLVINEYIKQNQHLQLNQDFYYWRDSNGNEVDLMVSNGNGFDIVEIKATKTITNSLFKGLDNLATVADDTIKRKVLVYGGKDSQTRTNHQIWSWKDIKSEF